MTKMHRQNQAYPNELIDSFIYNRMVDTSAEIIWDAKQVIKVSTDTPSGVYFGSTLTSANINNDNDNNKYSTNKNKSGCWVRYVNNNIHNQSNESIANKKMVCGVVYNNSNYFNITLDKLNIINPNNTNENGNKPTDAINRQNQLTANEQSNLTKVFNIDKYRQIVESFRSHEIRNLCFYMYTNFGLLWDLTKWCTVNEAIMSYTMAYYASRSGIDNNVDDDDAYYYSDNDAYYYSDDDGDNTIDECNIPEEILNTTLQEMLITFNNPNYEELENVVSNKMNEIINYLSGNIYTIYSSILSRVMTLTTLVESCDAE